MHAFFFEWDPEKARRNILKHGVSFEQAQTVFLDENGILIADPQPRSGEGRFLLPGLDGGRRELVVHHCMRQDGFIVRIISARRADEGERTLYWERL